MMRRVGLTTVVVVSALLLGGCVMISSSGGGSGSDAAGPAAPKTRASVSAASRVGESQTSGSWKVTVNTVQLQKQLSDGESAAAGNTLMVIDTTFFNVGTTNYLQLKPGQAVLTDSKNKVVAEFPTKLGAFNAKSESPIPVQYGGDTAYVYEVPAAPSGYIWSFKPDPTGKVVLRWRVP